MIEAEWKEHTVTSGTDQLVYTTIFVYFYLSKFVLDKSITYTYVSLPLLTSSQRDFKFTPRGVKRRRALGEFLQYSTEILGGSLC